MQAIRSELILRANFTRMLYQGMLINKKIWLDKPVRELLLAYRKKILTDKQGLSTGYPDYLLGIIQPEICLTIYDNQAAVFLRGDHSIKSLSGKVKELDHSFITNSYQTGGATFLTIANSRLIEFAKLAQPLEMPDSVAYQNKLAEVLAVQQEIDKNQELQSLSDSELNLKNQSLVNKLYPHQRVAVRWLLEKPRAYLADDMGLGKTLSVLTYAEELISQDKINFLLIICPNSLVLNWQEEAKQWLNNFQIMTTPDTKVKRQKFLEKINAGVLKHSALVLNYEEARLPYVTEALSKILKQKQVLICFDESQRVKNPNSKTFVAASQLSSLAKYRVLLSGTPTPKDITDLWTQVYLLDDGERFGDNYYTWLNEVAELGSKWSRVAVKKFCPVGVENALFRFQELLLRRHKDQVLNLPDKIFLNRHVKLTGGQKTLYEQVRKELLVNLQNTDGKTYQKKIESILEEFLRAVQIASNPRIINPDNSDESAKFLELDQLVEELVVNNREKIVIWTNYKQNIYDLLERYQNHHIKAIYGGVAKTERQTIVDDFQNNPQGTQIIVAIPAAAGVGLTLTAASTAIYLDKTWNAEHWLQSIDRIYRIGQKKRVRIISLQAGGVDYMISKNLTKKSDLIKQVLGEGDQPLNLDQVYPDQSELIAGLEQEFMN